MNSVCLTGRLVRDPELRKTQGGVAVASFTVAVDRPYQKDKEREVDFIPCVAWRNTAEFVARYFHKGDPMEVHGAIRIRSYDKDSEKRYATEVLVDNVAFTQSKSNGGTQQQAGKAAIDMDEFEEILGDGEVPF